MERATRSEPYVVHLANFEGPLDLLLHLIRREEMNIYDIPIARITEQYLAAIQDLADLDLDRASEFLVMAATLLRIKSQMLLPKPPRPPADGEAAEEPEEDPRAALVQQLVTYSRFKEAAEFLREREREMLRVYTRGLFLEQPAGPPALEGIDLADLVRAFQEVLREEWNWREVPRAEIPLREKIREIRFRVARSPGGIRFRDLFTRGCSRLEVVVTFLALLELMRRREVKVVQRELFGEILVLRAEPPDHEAEGGREDG
ncbi:MAG: hypothetical protein A6D92_07685 [Symbiobacterium thermophilum]|uniref:Segregation and condensation protein A n=1 Tax=Symbiobacterium thermophilum TaxID=2734 RepID=A0A1Y2T4L8_SYMTR|nr:MAG: hypothetical protein A6D92_07685 [Symbiobacterium thermophilum]PZN74175.1 MAG: segregation/condensation protein A [Bacillota bacterium]